MSRVVAHSQDLPAAALLLGTVVVLHALAPHILCTLFETHVALLGSNVAKGQGYMAAMIRQIAAEHGVPVLERKSLAQTLYKMAEVGEEIPREGYKAIAEVLAYAYEITQRGYRHRPILA
jgi:flagellar biosynthesis protein FlhB